MEIFYRAADHFQDDVTPFGDALTRHFLRRPLAEHLPRKFKIALSGCAHDCALAASVCLGNFSISSVNSSTAWPCSSARKLVIAVA